MNEAPAGGLLRRVALYGASRGVTEGLFGVRGVALGLLLGPAAFGSWALLRLVMRYTALSTLTVLRGLEVEMATEGRSAARTALGFILLVSGTLALGALAASFVVTGAELRLLLRGLAAVAVVEAVWMYALISLRLRGDLRRYAAREMTHALLQVVCACALAALWGLPGAYAGLVVAGLGGIALVAPDVPMRPALRFAPLRRLLGIGLPIVATATLATALSTADRWVVAALGGTTLLGYYTFAASIAGVAATFAWVVRTVIFTEVYGRARASGTERALRSHLEQTLVPFAWLYAPILGAAAFGIGPAVALLMPRYADAVAPAQLFILSGAATGLASLAAVGVVAAERQRILPLFSAIALAVNVATSYAALSLGGGLQLVAAGALLSQTIFAAAVVAVNARVAGMAQPTRFALATLAPIAWCAVVVAVVVHWLPGPGLREALVGLALFVAAITPLLPRMRRELGRVRE